MDLFYHQVFYIALRQVAFIWDWALDENVLILHIMCQVVSWEVGSKQEFSIASRLKMPPYKIIEPTCHKNLDILLQLQMRRHDADLQRTL